MFMFIYLPGKCLQCFQLTYKVMYQRMQNKRIVHKGNKVMKKRIKRRINKASVQVKILMMNSGETQTITRCNTLLKKLDQLIEKQWSRKTNTIVNHLEEFQTLCRCRNKLKQGKIKHSQIKFWFIYGKRIGILILTRIYFIKDIQIQKQGHDKDSLSYGNILLLSLITNKYICQLSRCRCH